MQQPLHAPVQPERSALPVHERRLETTAPLPAPQSSLCTSLTAAAVPARTALAAALSTPSLTATLASATLAAAVAATSLASATISTTCLSATIPPLLGPVRIRPPTRTGRPRHELRGLS